MMMKKAGDHTRPGFNETMAEGSPGVMPEPK